MLLQHPHEQLVHYADRVHVGAILETAQRRGCNLGELHAAPPVRRNVDDLPCAQLHVHGLNFVKIRPVFGLHGPRIHRRPEFKVVVIGHGKQVLAGMRRNEPNFDGALRHQIVVTVIQFMPERGLGARRCAHHVIRAFGHHGRAQKGVVVFERFHEAGFFQEVPVVFGNVARLLVAAERFGKSMQRERHVQIGCIGFFGCVFHVANAHVKCAVGASHRRQRARFHQSLVGVVKQHGLPQVAHLL